MDPESYNTIPSMSKIYKNHLDQQPGKLQHKWEEATNINIEMNQMWIYLT